MKLIKRISLLAVLLTVVFSLNVSAQSETAERLDVKNITRGGEKKIEEIIVVKDASFFDDIAQTTSYAFATTTTGSLTDMSTGTTTLVAANTDDTASALTNIGFDFYFQGVRYTQFSVNDNGNIRLGATSQTSTPYQPLAQAGIPIITAYGGDQRTHTTGSVRFKVIGAAPNRTLVIEWFNNQSNFNAGGTADLTYQVRLSETSGVIEFVYGSMTLSAAAVIDANSNDPQIGFSSSNVANTVGSVDAPISGAPAPSYNGASAVPTNNTTYTVAGPITVLTSATNGSRRTFSFTPPLPTPPTALNFTAVTATSYTLNWTDSADEDLYAIYRSTDGINYTFQATAAENAITFPATGLTPGTNYFWRVFSVSEGAFSATSLDGSQMTSPAGNDTCNGVGGNWMTPASWTDGSVPTAGDNVTIGPACVMVIDTAAPVAINVTVQSGGTLIYHPTTASTLTANGDITVDAGGIFNAGAGVLTTHVLNIGGSSTASAAAGNLTVNGTFDMFTTASVTTNFFGSTNGTLSGAGATADFFSIVGQKGTNQTAILDVTRVITIAPGTGAGAALGNHISVTGGTIRISSATVATPWFGSQTITGANGRLWINDAGASLQSVGAGTSATGAGSPTFTGGLRIDSGLFGYGQGNNTLTFSATTGSLVMNGGTINMFGIVLFSANSSHTQTAGNFNVDPQNVTATAATNNIFRYTGPNVVAFTGGTVTIVDPHAATGTGRALSISTSSATVGGYNLQGGTFRFGDGVSTTAGSVDGFDMDPFVGTGLVPLGNVTVHNTATNAATRFVRVSNALAPFQIFILGDLNVSSLGGSRFNLNGHLVAFGKDIINDGIIDGTVASSRLYWISNGVASNYSGSGTQIAPLVSWDIDNPLGVTISPAITNVVVRRVILFTGNLSGSNKLTLGNGDATVNTVQIGNTTTPTAAGAFDVPFTFNLGAGGETISYLRTTANRTTGNEVTPTRSLVNLTYDDDNVARTLTVAGGNLTVGGILTLTNGVVVTDPANTLIHNGATATRAGTCTTNECFVDGPLTRDWAVATGATYTYHVGEGVYSPVGLAAIIDGDAALTAEAINATLTPFPASDAISRNWSLNKSVAGTLTADVSFTYDEADDVPGGADETDFRLYRRDSGSPTEVCGTGCVNEGTNVATVTGLSSFSRWTIAEIFAPTAAMVNVGGRITTANGIQGLPRVMVTITGGNLPQPVTRMTNPFGYYNFEDLQAGQTYVITVGSKQYTFSVPSRIVTPDDNVTNADFFADETQ